MRDVVEALAAALADGRGAVLVTVVEVTGNPPSRPGAKLLVVRGRVEAGTLGCSGFDAAGVELAAGLTGSQEASPATMRRRIVATRDGEQAIELFGEHFEPDAQVIVMGSGPVGRAVAGLAASVGRRVRNLDEDGDPVAGLRSRPPGARDAVVVSDHEAPGVEDVLRIALESDAFFVGMLGSRRRAPQVTGRLRDRGVPADRVAALHMPCGLDIGGRSPAEIALSIVAEIVAVERGRSGGSLLDERQPRVARGRV